MTGRTTWTDGRPVLVIVLWTGALIIGHRRFDVVVIVFVAVNTRRICNSKNK